jgi:hypothetical protein
MTNLDSTASPVKNAEKLLKRFKTHIFYMPSWILIALFAKLCFTVTMGKMAAALPHHRE